MPDSVVVVQARLSIRDGGLQLNARSVSLPPAELNDNTPVDLRLAERICTEPLMNRLVDLLQQYPGEAPVRLHVQGREATTLVELGERFQVRNCQSLFSDLKVLLGRDCLQ